MKDISTDQCNYIITMYTLLSRDLETTRKFTCSQHQASFLQLCHHCVDGRDGSYGVKYITTFEQVSLHF